MESKVLGGTHNTRKIPVAKNPIIAINRLNAFLSCHSQAISVFHFSALGLSAANGTTIRNKDACAIKKGVVSIFQNIDKKLVITMIWLNETMIKEMVLSRPFEKPNLLIMK